jgi:hypothetical protein
MARPETYSPYKSKKSGHNEYIYFSPDSVQQTDIKDAE